MDIRSAQQWLLFTVMGVGFMACAVRPPEVVICEPADLWLTVAGDRIEIQCDRSGSLLNCEISFQDEEQEPRTGFFTFADGGEPEGFDPGDSNLYGAWDGHSIYMTDGRVLRELGVITSSKNVSQQAVPCETEQ